MVSRRARWLHSLASDPGRGFTHRQSIVATHFLQTAPEVALDHVPRLSGSCSASDLLLTRLRMLRQGTPNVVACLRAGLQPYRRGT